MCNKKFYKNLLKIVSPTASIQSDVLKIGFKKKIIFYERKKRKSESQNSFFKLLNSFLEFYFNSSYWLVRLFMFAGIFSFILSIIYIFTILYAYLNNSTPFIGWSPIIILILIFGSLNLIFTGIVGEYLINFIKIYNKKETAFIDYTVNFKSKK
jgi:dolichol-phosphate mannosyltransferase